MANNFSASPQFLFAMKRFNLEQLFVGTNLESILTNTQKILHRTTIII